MEEASNTCIVAFQLMQVIDLQTIQIMARFCQGDILAMKRIQYGARKCVAENVRGFSVAVLPAAPLLFRNSLGTPPRSVSGLLRLGQSVCVKQSAQYDFGGHSPCFPKRLEPLIELGDLPWTLSIFHLDEKRFRHKQMSSECVRVPFVTLMRLHIVLIVNRAAPM